MRTDLNCVDPVFVPGKSPRNWCETSERTTRGCRAAENCRLSAQPESSRWWVKSKVLCGAWLSAGAVDGTRGCAALRRSERHGFRNGEFTSRREVHRDRRT